MQNKAALLLEVLACLLLAAGVGLVVAALISGPVSVGAGVLCAGLVVLGGAWVSQQGSVPVDEDGE